MTELHLVKRCDDHGIAGYHKIHEYAECLHPCEGGSVTVLDPVLLSKVIHDLQDEYGHDTRHDIGLALVDALEAGQG